MRTKFLFSQSHAHVFHIKVFRKLFKKSICSNFFFFCEILILLHEVAYPVSPVQTPIHISDYNCMHTPAIQCFKVPMRWYLGTEETIILASNIIGLNCHTQVSLFPFRNSVPKLYEQSNIAAHSLLCEPTLPIHQQPSSGF